jgi:hypothetical protein
MVSFCATRLMRKILPLLACLTLLLEGLPVGGCHYSLGFAHLTHAISPSTEPSQPIMGSMHRFSSRFRRAGCLEGHGIGVLGVPCPRRSCSGQSNCAQLLSVHLSEYGGTVLLSGL